MPNLKMRKILQRLLIYCQPSTGSLVEVEHSTLLLNVLCCFYGVLMLKNLGNEVNRERSS